MTPNTPVSVVRFINNGQDIIDAVPSTRTPRQSDWTYIDGEDYKVYDVQHVIHPESNQTTANVFIWKPDPDAPDDHLMVLYERAIESRVGERTWPTPETGGSVGTPIDLIHKSTTLATVTASVHPQNNEGIRLDGNPSQFLAIDTTSYVETGEHELATHLMTVAARDKGAQMANVHRTLVGQRSNAEDAERNR